MRSDIGVMTFISNHLRIRRPSQTRKTDIFDLASLGLDFYFLVPLSRRTFLQPNWETMWELF